MKTGSRIPDVTKALQANEKIQFLMRTSGDYDYLSYALCKDREDALELLSVISGIKGIEKVENHVILEALKIMGVQM